VQLKMVSSMTPLLRRLDRVLPWPGVSLIAVARRRDDAPLAQEENLRVEPSAGRDFSPPPDHAKAVRKAGNGPADA